MSRLIHPIAPIYDRRSRVLLLGSFPSPRSREQGFYYGHPQNRFWRVLAEVLGEPFPQTVDARRAMLLRRGIALWDVLASCEISGASDASIRAPLPNELTPILATADIRLIGTTGQKAAALYRKYLLPQTGIPAVALPSTSPANCAATFPRLCEAYQMILSCLEEREMEKIASFAINHDKLKEGIYVSRIDGDVVTYDIRMTIPNAGDYLSNGAIHTFEHLFATYARSTPYGDRILYIGPMGCRTGFYLLCRDTLAKADVIRLVVESFAFIADYEGEIPGAKQIECGNYLEHDLAGARVWGKKLAGLLADWTPAQMVYEV